MEELRLALRGLPRVAIGLGSQFAEVVLPILLRLRGVEDQPSAVALSWMPSAMYCAVKVVDDVHQNPGSNSDSNEAGWNGDSVQIAFSTAERTAIGSPGRVCHS